MSNAPTYRLAPSAIVEPLINAWPAWAHVVSPAAASLHLVNYQIPAMQSYLDNPGFHVQASRDPALVGGPFCDVPAANAPRVRSLLAETRSKMAGNIEFARSFVEFHNFLSAEAGGQPLESFYGALPAGLRGYVELVYDYYNNPIIRAMEGMLYASEYYDEELQSLRLFRLSRDNERPFFMSTPRFVEKDQVDWRIPFKDAGVDELYLTPVFHRQVSTVTKVATLLEELARAWVEPAAAL